MSRKIVVCVTCIAPAIMIFEVAAEVPTHAGPISVQVLTRNMHSKRKSLDQLDTAKSKKKRVESKNCNLFEDGSEFGSLVTEAGAELKTIGSAVELTKDQSLFQRQLAQSLKRHPDYPQVVEEFTSQLFAVMENPLLLRSLLMPTTITSEDGDVGNATRFHDSFIRLLLGIDALQPKVMSTMLEKLVELSIQDGTLLDDKGADNIPRLIMNQFCWLDRVVNPKEVVNKMFEVVSVTPFSVQREIITCLPEVVDDAQHSDVTRQLKDLLMTERPLLLPILDALSNLNLTQDLLSEVRQTIADVLPSADLDDLPVILRFLLQTVTSEDALQVVNDIRLNMDLSTSLLPVLASTPHANAHKKISSVRDSVALTVDALRSGLRFQKFVASSWLKAIECVKTSTDLKVLDVMVLLILHSCEYRKSVESLVRSKISAGQLTEAVLQTTFNSYGQVLQEYFESVVQLAGVLLRSPQPIIVYFACAVYKQSFLAFDTYCQQEIVGNLVTHIGSGCSAEVESSLDILLDLVTNHLDKMAPFAIFVKGVLDYLDNLDLAQVRKLYQMLGRLAFSSLQQDSIIQDGLHIIIRKQLSNNNIRYQQMGVVGAVMIIMNLAIKRSHVGGNQSNDILDDLSSSVEPGIPDDVYQQVISLLKLAKAGCSRSPLAVALYMEELAVVIKQRVVDPKVEEWIMENVINEFQDDYVIDVNEEKEGDGDLPWCLEFGIDTESEGSIAINLLPLVEPSYQFSLAENKSQNNSARFMSIWCLTSNFRLLQICQSNQHNGDLEEIDALLGCPIKLPKLNELKDKFETLSLKERRIFCDSVFFAINWFREIMNAFSCQKDPEMKVKVIRRLFNILELQQILEKCLPVMIDYVPPPANFDVAVDKPVVVATKKSNPDKSKTRKKKSSKKKKVDSDDESSDEVKEESRIDCDTQKNASHTTQTQDGGIVGGATASKSPILMSSLIVHFRELDFSVFNILNYTVLAASSEIDSNAKEQLHLQPHQLIFLLEELTRKLNHSLLAHDDRKKCFLKAKSTKPIGFRNLDQLGSSEVAREMVALLPSICNHLESVSAFFQALIVANDGLCDGPGSDGEEFAILSSCYCNLLQVLLAVFSWNGFLLSKNRSLLLKSLTCLSSRLSTASVSQLNFSDIVRQAFSYVENLGGSIPTLPAAVYLCRLLSCLASKTDSDALKHKTGDLSLSFLKRDWPGEKKGAVFNEHLQSLLHLCFSHCHEVQTLLEDLCSVAIPELLQADKNAGSNSFPTLTRQSYSVFYRTLLSELIDYVKTIPPGKTTDPIQDNVDKLLSWSVAVRIFHVLVNLVKTFDARSNLTAVLKFGRLFVESFLRLCMPMLDHMFRSSKDDIQSLLKNLQLSTRALHHMCGHSKIMKDISLTNQVPQLKRTLEVFVYRVKAMLTINQCLSAFWLGNLKNRDLKGEEIMSQVSRAESSDVGSEEENLSGDDDDEDVIESTGKNKTRNCDDSDASDSNLNPESYSEAF